MGGRLRQDWSTPRGRTDGAIDPAALTAVAGAASAHARDTLALDRVVHGYSRAHIATAGVALIGALLALQARVHVPHSAPSLPDLSP
jgi:hypothetical protein